MRRTITERILMIFTVLLVAAQIRPLASAQTAPTRVDTSLAGLPSLEWKPRAPGVWIATIGRPEIGTMEFADTPMVEALKELGEPALPAVMRGARGDVHGGYACVRLPLGMEEHVYGLGMRADGDVNLRSKSYQLRVTPSHRTRRPRSTSPALVTAW